MRLVGLAAVLGGALLALAAPPQALAQEFESARWRATPLIGVTSYDESSSLQTAAFVGGEAHYLLTPSLRVGVGLNVARPIVDGSYFPLLFLRVHQDTSMLVEVGQQVTQVNYMGLISAVRSMGSVNLFAQAGLGGYTFFMDRQVMSSMEKRGAAIRHSGMLVPLGVGISLGRGSAIRLEARDDIIMGFDRDAFNPVEPRFRNLCTAGVHAESFCVEEANRTPPAAKETIHNFKFILGFELIPGQRR